MMRLPRGKILLHKQNHCEDATEVRKVPVMYFVVWTLRLAQGPHNILKQASEGEASEHRTRSKPVYSIKAELNR